jgi:hypothetical protein
MVLGTHIGRFKFDQKRVIYIFRLKFDSFKFITTFDFFNRPELSIAYIYLEISFNSLNLEMI